MKHWRETAAILEQATRLSQAGEPAAIATVVRISGSAYRRPGAKLLVEKSGKTTGGISGGCLEADVRSVALEVLQGAPPRLLHYDTGSDEETVWGLGLGCQGAVDLLVQRADRDLCRVLRELMAEREPHAVITLVPTPLSLGFIRGNLVGSSGSAQLDRVLASRSGPLLKEGQSQLQQIGEQSVFIDVLRPPPHLAIFGAGDDAQPLSTFASQAGFDVTVVDHRPAYLTEARFPAPAARVLRRPADGIEGILHGSHPFAVVQTHALIHDRDWLRALVARPLGYLGLLGPRVRGDEVLRQIGVAPTDKLFAPVGLDLGADGPEQVAVAIVAEMLAVYAGREPGHLRARKGGIHE